MPRTVTGFVAFQSWDAVLAQARDQLAPRSRLILHYWAPLDLAPRVVRVKRVFKNGSIRIDPLSTQADNFTADAGHLDRFYRRVETT